MADLVKTNDYSDRDFTSVFLRLKQLIPSVFPEWTDWNQTNFGVILVQSFCFVMDVFNYYQDGQAREAHWGTAQQRRSLLKLAQLIGYIPAGPQAATVDVKLLLSAVPAGNVTFPVGTTVQTQDVEPIVFQLLTAVTILAGANPPQVIASFEHSESATDTFASTGRANQTFQLSEGPFLPGTLAIVATNGTFTEVSSLLSSKATDKHFQVVVDQNELARVIFGDGITGTIPTGTITANYRTGGGAGANVAAGRISKINGSFVDSLTNPVVVTPSNAEAATGGANRLTNAQIRALGPESLRVLTRTVSREDFEINARRVPGVARALMLTSDENSDIPENAGYLYVIPSSGGQPSGGLRASVLTMVTETYPTMITFDVTVAGSGAPSPPGNVPYKTVNVQATVSLRSGNPGASVVKQRIVDALTAYFAITNADGSVNENVDFGYNVQDVDGGSVSKIFRSDIFNVVRDTDGVQSVELSDFLLNNVADDVVLTLAEFPVLGSIAIYNKATGGLL